MAAPGFHIYREYSDYFSRLTAEQVGTIVLAMLSYFETGAEPELSGVEYCIWPVFKRRIDEDLAKYEAKCEKNRENGGKRRDKPEANGSERKRTVASGSERLPAEAKEANSNYNCNNNYNSNNGRDNMSGKAEQSPPKEESVICKDVIDYLNEVCGTAFKASSRATQRLISARVSEGFALEDFKTVIRKKHDEWSSDQKMSIYLRPETLFGTKFEGYLNQQTAKSSYFNEDNISLDGYF